MTESCKCVVVTTRPQGDLITSKLTETNASMGDVVSLDHTHSGLITSKLAETNASVGDVLETLTFHSI